MTNNNVPAVIDAPIGRLEPLRPLPVNDVARAMQEYQQGLHAIVDASDWQVFADRDGREHGFVKRSGWRKVATWFGLDLIVASTVVERVRATLCPQCGHSFVSRGSEGDPLRALVTGRAVAPNGRVAEDVGACSIDERAFSKPEHDMLATACTRALNRATSNLVGMGELSAEEVDERDAVQLPDWAQPADEQTLADMHGALSSLLGAENRATAVINTVNARYGTTPIVLARFVDGLHAMLGPELRAKRASTPTTTSEA
jgi:hypothetical protein